MEFSGDAGYSLWKSRRNSPVKVDPCSQGSPCKGRKSLGACLPPLNWVRTTNLFNGYIAHVDVLTGVSCKESAFFSVSKAQVAGNYELLRYSLSDVARSQIFSWNFVTGLQLEGVGSTRLVSWKSFGRFFPTVKGMPSVYFFPSCTISFHLVRNSAPDNVGLLLPRAMDSVPVLFILDLTNCLHWLKAMWYCAFLFSSFATIPHSYWEWFLFVQK